MVYKINDEIVFGKAFKVTESDIVVDIFGNTIDFVTAKLEAESNAVVDESIKCLHDKIQRNIALGYAILSTWREYVIIKDSELGITGQGVAQLEKFYLIGLALMMGMLDESSSMLLAMDENVVITQEIKQKFSLACKSADHITM